MRKYYTSFVLIAFLSFLGSCKNIENGSLQETSGSIEKCINDYVTEWEYKPALEVSVYGKNGVLTYNYKGGYFSVSNDTEISDDSLFILYSITKSMTAAAILDLVDSNRLSLTNIIGDFFQNLNPIYINTDATIEELLTHRSGIQDYTDNSSIIYDNPYAQNRDWNPAAILDYISRPADNRGSFIYSSSNYILLGMIIEKITDNNLYDFFEEKFFVPCNVNMLLYPQSKLGLNNIVHPHVYPDTFMGLSGDGKTPIDISNLIKAINELSIKCSWAAGGMVGNSENTAKWGYELLSENGTVKNSIRNKIVNSVRQFSDASSLSDAYGFGIRKLMYSGCEFLGSYGRSFGCENLMFYNKDKDVCIVVLSASNTRADGNPNIDELMYAIFDSIL